MPPRLLIINNHDSFTYNLVDLIRRLKVFFEVINVEKLVENSDFSVIDNFSHILISPGPDTPDAYPQLFKILDNYYRHKAILGVCLGHQTICRFFGAALYNLPEVRHGQTRRLKIKSDSRLFSGLPPEFQIGLYHSWAVSTHNFPAVLEIIGMCEDEIIMGIQHKTLPIYGVQFHPESYISEFGEWILRNFLS